MGCGPSNRLSPLFETNEKKKRNSKEGFLLVLGCSSEKKRKTEMGEVFEGERKGVKVFYFLTRWKTNVGFGSNLTW